MGPSGGSDHCPRGVRPPRVIDHHLLTRRQVTRHQKFFMVNVFQIGNGGYLAPVPRDAVEIR